ncbi:MAG: hypothetical protein HUU46_06795 [Candidatus Hydrogenedentes bacterium]|nr:hypothetical protein [Candidatus Hydrogenedentota bacterium]
MHWTRCALVPCVVAALLLGCESEPPPKPTPPGERPPSAADIRRQFESVLQPIFDIVDDSTADTRVPEELAAQVQTQLAERKSKYAAEPAYKEAIGGVIDTLENKLRVVRDKQNGVLALYLCTLIRFFDPENSRVVRYEKWGETVKNRPVATINGWYEPRDAPVRTIYAFIEVYTPEDGQTHHLQVREGEEFFGLRFVEMIGNKSGILFEYLKTRDRFKVFSKSWLQKQ